MKFVPQQPMKPSDYQTSHIPKKRGIIGKAMDKVMGISRVDNEADQFSALNRKKMIEEATKRSKEFMEYANKKWKAGERWDIKSK